jgi:MFS family permease
LQSLLYVGSVVGLIIIPYISDNWGRTKAIKSSWGLFVFGILSICISDSSIMVGIGQFLCGFGCYPALTICYSFLNEQILRSKRQRYCIIIQLFLVIGGCSIGFVFIPRYDWRSIFYTLFGLMLITYALLSKLIESPKFLILKCKN